MKLYLLLFVLLGALVSAKRPNILFILTDDQAPHTLSSYGNSVCQTPNIDKLSASGMVLDRAYHMGSMSGAVCSPSRTMIMSGRTLWHLPSRGKKHLNKEKGKVSGVDILNNTIPAVFNRAGYETFRTCKNGNSYNLANALFQIVKDKSCRNADEDNGSQWHGRQVLNYLEERSVRKEEKPFMIYFGFSHPHDARTGRDDLLAKYGARNVKKPLTEVNPDAPKLPISWLPE